MLKNVFFNAELKIAYQHFLNSSQLVGSCPLIKYSYELADPLTVHFLDHSIVSSCKKKVVFVFMFQSEIIL